MPMKLPKGGISLREFARRMGVSDTAVRKGVKTGRLPSSVLGYWWRCSACGYRWVGGRDKPGPGMLHGPCPKFEQAFRELVAELEAEAKEER
jgi:hypothetical protein